MRRELSDAEIEYFIEEGYSEEEIERGFGIFTSDFMGGAEHIERYDEINIYDGDGDAAEYAEKHCGIKLINDIPFDKLPDYEFGYYVDTEENVEIIKEHLKDRYSIDWRV